MVRILIEELEKYAKTNNVPIMSKDTIEKIREVILDNNITSILEIGTAIAYSTICFRSTKKNVKITSIERDKLRYSKAVENVQKSKLDNILLINEDALNVEIEDKFDLIIIDAAKSQNIKFFEKYKNNLNDRGIIIIDNLSFHGFVGNSQNIESKNLRAMVRKIEEFLKYLSEIKDFDIEYIEVGDKIAICRKINL